MEDSNAKRPNFLFILADDLGFSDIGCYGSEIQTPNIDQLAAEGTRMLNHHAAAACSPTRAMLLSGTDAHLGGLGCLIEYKQNAKGAQRWSGKPGYEGFLNQDVATLPEILEDNGYFTVMSGKWHLGMRTSQGPWARGFQKAFAMLPGCCNHYGWEPVQDKFPIGGRPIHAEQGEKVDITPNKTEDSEGFYSTDYYTDQLIRYLDGRTDDEKSKPFFSFLPYTAPHWPLQCSRAQRGKYKGAYDDGPYALRERRLKRLVELGIVDKDVIPHKVETTTVGAEEWDTLTPEERKLSSRAMETYAGMVDSIDVNIGKVVDYLKRTGEYDNTFIVFMSDNGAEGAASVHLNPTVLGTDIRTAIHKYYDNSYDNIGAYNSYSWLGPLWAQASTAPSRLFKCFPSQGGILVPCVIKPPINNFPHLSAGSLNRPFTTVMDFVPTFLDLAGVSLPEPSGTARPMTVFRGRNVHAVRGKSWVPFFARGESVETDEAWAIHSSSQPIGWELFARGALRKGDWKIVHFAKAQGGAGEGDDGWELFNVVDDPGETKNLAQVESEKLKELLKCWDEYVVECGVVWGEGAVAPGLGKDEAPELWEDETELQRRWMDARGGVKCDEQKPTCTQCSRGSRNCIWIDEQPRRLRPARRPNATACDACREKKLKCTGGSDEACQRCRSLGIECLRQRRRDGPSSAPVPTGPPQAHTSRQDDLPEGKELDELIQLYFSSVHHFGFFAFIHPLHFQRLLANGKAPRELTLIIIASALRFAAPVTTESLARADAWADGAINALLPEIHRGFGAIQLMTALLAQHYDMHRGHFTSAWLLGGSCTR
ncbi:alkaline-phosphatase-like protein [Aspergillus undulatus]|uniref:alkaline-phosphatase-like protein n=1 Tax=Aspergillus undulatus TaxID=1810928 RepID=UPI003CCCDA68